jgi:hypothetical protein
MLIALIRAFANLWKNVNVLPPATKPPPQPMPPTPASTTSANPVGNPLEELPLDYLIGTDVSSYHANRVVEAGYDSGKPALAIASIKYCNLFDEKNTGAYAPYLHTSDTAAQYGEGQIDPGGLGWHKNLVEQFTRAKSQGFLFVELDNPDAYRVGDVVGAVNLAAAYGLKVIAKNPLAMEGDPLAYVKHPAVVGVIVERGAGSPSDMDKLRKRAGKPSLPIWFVAFRNGNEDGRAWAGNTANTARAFKNMGVTFSGDGEYTSVQDILLPNAGPGASPSITEHHDDAPSINTKPALPYDADDPPSLKLRRTSLSAVARSAKADDIVRAMKAHNCEIDIGADRMNIVYVEGADATPDGKGFKPNANRPDAFDSLRILLRVLADGTATILGMWAATTHAGKYYEQVHLLNPGGAFHIATGRQTAWVMGIYSHGNYEALLQEAPLYGTRDKNRNFKREGPTIHEVVGAHHHWGYDFGKDSVQTAAAGCQVGRTEAGHQQFIALLKTDARYRADRNFLWSSTVMPVEWVV